MIYAHFSSEISGQRESNPLSKFRDVAQFRHKHALDCALEGKLQISRFARTAQNYAVRVSEFVRNKTFFLSPYPKTQFFRDREFQTYDSQRNDACR